MAMKRSITRIGKVLVAEVSNQVYVSAFGRMVAISVDMKEFKEGNFFFSKEPTLATYERANKWLDEVIELHKAGTVNSSVADQE
jgi:hypothetical protein